MSDEVANLIASKFIARTDVKAVQYSNGAWSPHTQGPKENKTYVPWRRTDLNAHLEGSSTFGHYLLSTDSRCKLFAFDVDLRKTGELPVKDWFSHGTEASSDESSADPLLAPEEHLREAWLNRAHVGRSYMKYQFKEIAHKLLDLIYGELGIPCAAAYSGGKGIHVYGFMGLQDGSVARDAIEIIMSPEFGFKPLRGNNFFECEAFPNLSIECFPKQEKIDGDGFGNLMRLPLGRNLKAPKEPTFFLDMNCPMAEFKPLDPIVALTRENPWETSQ